MHVYLNTREILPVYPLYLKWQPLTKTSCSKKQAHPTGLNYLCKTGVTFDAAKWSILDTFWTQSFQFVRQKNRQRGSFHLWNATTVLFCSNKFPRYDCVSTSMVFVPRDRYVCHNHLQCFSVILMSIREWKLRIDHRCLDAKYTQRT